MKQPIRILAAVAVFLAGLALVIAAYLFIPSASPGDPHSSHGHGDSHEHDDDHHHDDDHRHGADPSHDHPGESHEPHLSSIELSPETLAESALTIETANPRSIASTITAYGRVAPNEDHLAYVIPRYPGTLQEVRKRLGSPVEANEIVAVVQSSESLQSYDVRAPIAGTVIAKDAVRGEFVPEGKAILTIADLQTVWVDLNVYPRDFPKIDIGQPVHVSLGPGLPEARGNIDYISPFGAENSQTMLARIELDATNRLLRPGLFVTGQILVDQENVPVAVRKSAIQSFNGQNVVFVRSGNVFQPQPVTLGREDSDWVAVTSGLAAGQDYVADNSFILKADILKAGAAHDH